jgi:chemotaxis protein histidine kinase CheA
MFLAKLGPDDDPNQRPTHKFVADPPIQDALSKGFACKANGNLRVMIAKAKTLGGIHQFRTTSLNSITQLMAAMHQVSEITGGILSAIPMLLEIYSKKVSTGPNKPPRTVFVVTLTHRAAINDFLREVAEQTALRESMRKQIAAKEILELPEPGKEDLQEQLSIAQEFYGATQYIDVESEEVEKPKEEEKPEESEEKPKEEDAPAPKEEPEEKPKEKKKDETPPKEEAKAEEPKPKEEPEPSKPEEPAPEPEEEKPAIPDIDTKPPENADYAKASKELRKEFFKNAREKYEDDQIRDWLKRLWDIQSSSKLLTWQVEAMNEALKEK